MPLFHFNIADHVREPDLDGTELADEAEAREQAIIFAGQCLRDNPELIADGHDFRIEVTDQDGAPIFTVRIDLIEERAERSA